MDRLATSFNGACTRHRALSTTSTVWTRHRWSSRLLCKRDIISSGCGSGQVAGLCRVKGQVGRSVFWSVSGHILRTINHSSRTHVRLSACAHARRVALPVSLTTDAQQTANNISWVSRLGQQYEHWDPTLAYYSQKDIPNSESYSISTVVSHGNRAGLSIVPVVPWEGVPAARGPPPISCQIFTTLFWVWTFSVRLNVTTTKKLVNFFGEKVHRHR